MRDHKQASCSCRELKETFKKIGGVRKSRKVLRNLSRRCRRKRSKLRYYYCLKKIRGSRKTHDLCEALVVVDINDMEWTPSLNPTSSEVSEWHKHEQVAYWKSRALSLEYENRMLVQHLRNIYAKQTEDYENSTRQNKEINNEDDEEISSKNDDDEQAEEETPSVAPEKKFVPANEPTIKKRRDEMDKLYGKMAPRIMGMETAVQLNYELHADDGKANFWPHLPLNLKFD